MNLKEWLEDKVKTEKRQDGEHKYITMPEFEEMCRLFDDISEFPDDVFINCTFGKYIKGDFCYQKKESVMNNQKITPIESCPPDELEAISDMVVKLTEAKMNHINHLAVENFAPELFRNFLYELYEAKRMIGPEAFLLSPETETGFIKDGKINEELD